MGRASRKERQGEREGRSRYAQPAKSNPVTSPTRLFRLRRGELCPAEKEQGPSAPPPKVVDTMYCTPRENGGVEGEGEATEGKSRRVKQAVSRSALFRSRGTRLPTKDWERPFVEPSSILIRYTSNFVHSRPVLK